MVRDREENIFLFRPPVLVRQIERVECVSEEDALLAFVDFLENVGRRVVLVGIDEETVGVLLQKVLATNKKRFEKLVDGFSWWKKVFENSNYNNE